jgi:hypothetical protein
MTNLKKEFTTSQNGDNYPELLPELKKVINSLNETISKQKESNKYCHKKTVKTLTTTFLEYLDKDN